MNRFGLTDDDLRELTVDQDFQTLFKQDKVLDELEAETYNETKEFFSLNWFLGLAPVAVGKLPLQPLTPAKWSFLWAVGNSYARGGDCRLRDADVFLYVLAKDLRDLGCTVSELPVKAAGFTAAAGLDFRQAHEEIRFLVDVAFLPLQLLPQPKSGLDNEEEKDVPRFDVEWLADLGSVVTKESGEPASYILHRMPMNTACAYVVSARKAVDTKHEVGRRPSAQISQDMMERAYALGRSYLDRKRGKQ